jgi:hypothetical protein
MVENFGMPHFFLTLIFDETSNLRWKEIEDIENFVMFFNNTFSWKDCLVECVHYFAQGYKLSCQPMFLVVKHSWHCRTSCNMIGIATLRWVKA